MGSSGSCGRGPGRCEERPAAHGGSGRAESPDHPGPTADLGFAPVTGATFPARPAPVARLCVEDPAA